MLLENNADAQLYTYFFCWVDLHCGPLTYTKGLIMKAGALNPEPTVLEPVVESDLKFDVILLGLELVYAALGCVPLLAEE